MLAIARQKVERLDPSLVERMSFCHAPVGELPGLFDRRRFDLVLGHTLLEYVSEPWEILRTLIAVLRPGGILSLLFANTYAEPLRWALARGDLERARLALREPITSADLFGLARCTFTAEAMREAVAQMGVEVVAEHGIRIFADYVPGEKLADPEFYARLQELEMASGALSHYRPIARYNQFLGRKPKAT
jgi:SAM-dependent methyltransferase